MSDRTQTTVRIILPAVSKDAISGMLRELTKAIDAHDPDKVAHGLLGGSDGYGAEWDNAVFTMRPYYWGDCDCGAEENDTPHLPTCALELPNFLHKRTGLEVRWYKYIGRGMEMKGKKPNAGTLATILTECIGSLA